ncbi:LamG domain-containing protein [Planctomycetota bacterium]
MFGHKTKHLAIIALILGLALSATAEDFTWDGENEDANNVGYWDDPVNWDLDRLPTGDDKVEISGAGTIIVDDFDPNTAKEGNLLQCWWPDNVTLWVKSFDGSGPGGVLTLNQLQFPTGGAENHTLLVDAGQVNVTRIRMFPWGNIDPNASGTVIVNGGALNVERFSLADRDTESAGTLIVNGGQVNVTNRIEMAGPPAVVKIELNGGTLNAKELRATDALAIDVNEGSLVLDGDQSDLISQLVANGQLTIAGQTAQRGGLFVVYDAETGTTNISADPSLVNPNTAYDPMPKVGDVVAADAASLSWFAGDSTAAVGGHDVYFGMDPNAVENDSIDNALGAYQGRVDASEIAMPVELMLSQIYYWRVDQIAEDGTVYPGSVWSFTVAESLLVDDFEGYLPDDGSLPIEDPNLIYNNWVDGYDVADNGSLSELELMIVKQDAQSMQVTYDNNDVVVNSEVKRSFASAQDWSRHGIQSLSLKFRGEADNTFGLVYVKINDTKLTYPLSPSHLQFAQWKPWIIDLNDIDVTNVTSLAIGVDGTGKGTLYIDDIRLYAQEAELMPDPDSGDEPDKSGLVAHYLFDGNAQDSSGNDHHGTVMGTANWVDGVFGEALDFRGTTGVDCGDFDPTGGTGKFTLSLWCYWDGGPIQHLLTKSAGWGGDTMMFQIELKGNDSWVPLEAQNRFNLAYASYESGEDQAAFDVVSAHEWVHLAMTFDGTHASGYLNGIDSMGPKPTRIGGNVAASVLLGVTENGDRLFQGMMDDVRIYNYPLTPAEVIGTIGVDLGYKPF